MSDKNVFEKAIDVLNERGWTQGTTVKRDGSVCIFGAFKTALLGDPYELLSHDALQTWTHLGVTIDDSPIDWNDDPHRTVEDVILALKEAAVSWDGA